MVETRSAEAFDVGVNLVAEDRDHIKVSMEEDIKSVLLKKLSNKEMAHDILKILTEKFDSFYFVVFVVNNPSVVGGLEHCVYGDRVECDHDGALAVAVYRSKDGGVKTTSYTRDMMLGTMDNVSRYGREFCNGTYCFGILSRHLSVPYWALITCRSDGVDVQTATNYTDAGGGFYCESVNTAPERNFTVVLALP